jgi:uncharacterized membrane protein YGL010W
MFVGTSAVPQGEEQPLLSKPVQPHELIHTSSSDSANSEQQLKIDSEEPHNMPSNKPNKRKSKRSKPVSIDNTDNSATSPINGSRYAESVSSIGSDASRTSRDSIYGDPKHYTAFRDIVGVDYPRIRDSFLTGNRAAFYSKACPFFVGNDHNLLDELSFIYAYHSRSKNQILHCVSVAIVFFSFILLLSALSQVSDSLHISERGKEWPILPLFFIIGYLGFYLFLDFVTGLAFTLFMVLSYLLSATVLIPMANEKLTHSDQIVCWVVLTFVTILSLSIQGMGHLVFEKRFPAFRIFEFLVTTPFCMMLIVLAKFGYMVDVVQDIRELSGQWKLAESS